MADLTNESLKASFFARRDRNSPTAKVITSNVTLFPRPGDIIYTSKLEQITDEVKKLELQSQQQYLARMAAILNPQTSFFATLSQPQQSKSTPTNTSTALSNKGLFAIPSAPRYTKNNVLDLMQYAAKNAREEDNTFKLR